MADVYLMISMVIALLDTGLSMKNPENKSVTVEITQRTLDLIISIRDSWLKDETDPMTAGEFINVMCCAIIYRRKK